MRLIKNLVGFIMMVGFLMLLIGFFLPGQVRLSAETTVGASSEQVIDHLKMIKDYTGKNERDIGIRDIKILRNSPDSLYTVTSVGRDYKAYITYNLQSAKDSVKVKSTMLVDLGMNPVSRYYGLMLDARFGSFIEKNLQEMKLACEKKGRKAA